MSFAYFVLVGVLSIGIRLLFGLQSVTPFILVIIATQLFENGRKK